MRVIARCYAELNEYNTALAWARRATAEAPDTREPWCEVAMLAYRMGRWAECYGAALTALNITGRELIYTVDPEVWGAKPYDLAAIAAWNLGQNNLALKYAKQALEHAPDDERLQQNVKRIFESI